MTDTELIKYLERRLIRAESALLGLGKKLLETSYHDEYPEAYIPGAPLPTSEGAKP